MERNDIGDLRMQYEEARRAWLQDQKAKDRTARDLLTLITKNDPAMENTHTILDDIAIAAKAVVEHGELGYALGNRMLRFVQEVEWLLNREKTAVKEGKL